MTYSQNGHISRRSINKSHPNPINILLQPWGNVNVGKRAPLNLVQYVTTTDRNPRAQSLTRSMCQFVRQARCEQMQGQYAQHLWCSWDRRIYVPPFFRIHFCRRLSGTPRDPVDTIAIGESLFLRCRPDVPDTSVCWPIFSVAINSTWSSPPHSKLYKGYCVWNLKHAMRTTMANNVYIARYCGRCATTTIGYEICNGKRNSNVQFKYIKFVLIVLRKCIFCYAWDKRKKDRIFINIIESMYVSNLHSVYRLTQVNPI